MLYTPELGEILLSDAKEMKGEAESGARIAMGVGSEGEGKESFLSPLKALVGEELFNKDETSGHKIALKLAQ